MSITWNAFQYQGNVTTNQDLAPTLLAQAKAASVYPFNRFWISGFTLVSDTDMVIELSDGTQVRTFNIGDNYIVNVPPLSVSITRFVPKSSGTITMNYFYGVK